MGNFLKRGRFISAPIIVKLTRATIGVMIVAFVFIVGTVFALGVESSTVALDNNWVLRYSLNDTDATIIGADTVGTGLLTIPENFIVGSTTINIKKIGDDAFRGLNELKMINLPNSLEEIGTRAFGASGLKSIEIPASTKAVSPYCFQFCNNLTEVNFLGNSMQYFGRYAFEACPITKIEVPALLGGEPSDRGHQIGFACFRDCSELKSIVFKSGRSNGGVNYFSFGNCFSGCKKLDTVVWYCKKGDMNYGTAGSAGLVLEASKVFYTIDFYANKTDAENMNGRLARVTYPSTTKLLDIVKGIADNAYLGSETAPDAASIGGSGKVWGISNNAITDCGDLITDSYTAIPVDLENLDYGWVSSPEIVSYKAYQRAGSTAERPKDSYYYLAEGKADLSDLEVCGADGTTLAASVYSLETQKAKLDANGQTVTEKDPITGQNLTVYETVSPPIDVAQSYRILATGTGAYSSTKRTASIDVAQYKPNIINGITSGGVSATSGFAAVQAAEKLNSVPYFTVVTSAANWQFGLIASGLAGVGGGTVVYTDGASTHNDAYRAIIAAKSDSINIIGSSSVVPVSVENRIKSLSVLSGGSVDRFASASPQAMALDVYRTVKKYGSRYGYQWGSTAIIASPSKYFTVLPIAQYAHKMKAPIFFTENNGALSNDALSALSAGGFTNILIAGSAEYVSDVCINSVATTCSLTPRRLMDSGASAFEVSSLLISDIELEFNHSPTSIVVASAAEPSYVLSGAVLANVQKGVLFVCSSSENAKAIQNYIVNTVGKNRLKEISIVGDFSKIDSSFAIRINSIWGSALSTALGTGDTIEVAGSLYRFDGGQNSTYVKLMDKSYNAPMNIGLVNIAGENKKVTTVVSGAFNSTLVTQLTFETTVQTLPASLFSGASELSQVNIKNIEIRDIPASMFSGLPKLTTVSYAAPISTIGAGAFKGDRSLSKLNIALGKTKTIGAEAFSGCKTLSVTSLDATSIGASAFAGCIGLRTLALTSKSLKTISMKVFDGCIGLRSISIASTSLNSIGSSAFNGCKALKTLTLKTKKLSLKKIGASAFKGLSKKATIKAPKAKLKTYKKIFIKRGLSKKAKFKKC